MNHCSARMPSYMAGALSVQGARAVRIKAGPLNGRQGAAREDPLHDRGHGQACPMYRRRGRRHVKPLLTVNLGMINPRFLLKRIRNQGKVWEKDATQVFLTKI